jgi:DNA-binding HxlR family transcriptional regulator
MENKTIGEKPAEICSADSAKAQFERAMRMLTGKWKGEIIWLLSQGKHRFGELRRAIPEVTQHMLTVQLRDLEADGLVKRTIYAEVPPRVEYEITPSAQALRPVFEELLKWSQDYGFPDRARNSIRIET